MEFDVDPKASDIMSTDSQQLLFAAKRTGVIAATLLIPTLQFAGRNSLLGAVTGWSNDTFKVFHRWTARVSHSVSFLLLNKSLTSDVAHGIGYIGACHYGNYLFQQ